MNQASVQELLGRIGIVPVVVIDDAASAQDLANALVVGGLPLAEVTFRTPAAVRSLEVMAAFPGLTVGAGSVASAAQVDQAVEAGAAFVVSPGLSQGVVKRCQELDIAVFPGVATATEIMAARDLGLDVLKLFPCEILGGPKTLKALAAPFPGLRFVPTGGITPANVSDYFAEPSVLAIGGSWMVAPNLLLDKNFSRISVLAGEAVSLAQQRSTS